MVQIKRTIILAIIAIALASATRAFGAQSQDITITSREIVERLTRLEEGQKNLSQRIDDLNRRFDDLNRRIDDLRQTTLWGFGELSPACLFSWGSLSGTAEPPSAQ